MPPQRRKRNDGSSICSPRLPCVLAKLLARADGTISRTAAEWRREMPFRRHQKVTRNLYPRGAAVGARVVSAFACTIRMQRHHPGMAHDVRIWLRQHLDVVPGRQQAVHERAVEARFHAQIALRRAPGAAQQPARGVDRAVEWHPVTNVPREYRRLRLRLTVPAHGAIADDAAV